MGFLPPQVMGSLVNNEKLEEGELERNWYQ